MSDSTAGRSKASLFARDRRANRSPDPDDFLDHHFRRVDKRVAASFTAEQRASIRTMFGGRGTTRHPVDVRASLPFGRRRYYLVFLMGRDRRRRFRGAAEDRRVLRELLGTALLAAGVLLPLFALVLAFRSW